MKMSQSKFTSRILDTLDLDKGPRQHATPATNPPLHAHENGAPRQQKWNFRSVIGMPTFLAGNTCPDIKYDVY